MIKFSRTQQQHIENGSAKRNRLKKLAQKAATTSIDTAYPHTYIFSPPGLGKTFTVNQALTESKIEHYTISGNISMFSFGIGLAVIQYRNKKKKPIVIVVDDCDEILKNGTNINIMKNVLSGNKIYSYEKSLQSQLPNLSDLQREAIENFSSPDKMGFEVPTDNFIFIFTSNFKLPTDDDVKLAREKGLQKAVLLGHLNAIKSRCKPADFDLNDNEMWGWITDVTINEDCVDLSKEDKMILLDWMYSNWDNMNERSIRTVEKMAETMIEDPTGYRDSWEIDYLKY
jgi:hypothetical protein